MLKPVALSLGKDCNVQQKLYIERFPMAFGSSALVVNLGGFTKKGDLLGGAYNVMEDIHSDA